MIRTRLVVLTLIALVALPLCAADTPVRLGRDVVPVSQSITLKLDPRLDTYSGSTVVELDVKKAVPTFNLHSEEIKIEKISIDGVAATTAPGPEQTLVVTPGAPLKVGRAKLTIDFSNEYDRRAVGLYKMVRKDGEPYLFTQFQAIDARKAFPCWDEPIFKIPYQFTTSVPSQYEVVSNTPVEKESQADGWKTVQFKRTPPMPSYLLALAAGALEFTKVPGTSIPTRIITTKGSSHLTGTAVEQTAPVLAALEKYFGTKYPYDKLDLIAVPEYWFGAMENPGLITYTETAILIDPKTGTPTQKRTNARYNSHEIAHMWFGDLVTMAWWDDLWLNESFADWLGDKIVQQVYPQYGLETQELGQVQGIMNTDASVLANPIRKRDVYPEAAMREVGLAYNKGKAVISMFEKWVGPEEFRKGVQRHMAKHAWGNATATDFYESISKSIVKPMATFIDQPGVPLISAELTGANEVKLTQSRYLRYGSKAEPQTWIVPVALRYSDGKQIRTKTVLLDAPAKTFKLEGEKIAWLFPHSDATGYYRWRMPSEQFLNLASHATSDLSANERVAFLGNLGALLDSGSIHGNEFLDVLNRFSSESDPQVIGSVLTAMSKVGNALEEKDKPLFAAYVRRTLGPVLERIGYERKQGESQNVAILRGQLLGWLANVGEDPKTIAFAKAQAAKYMTDPASVDPALAATALAINAYFGGDEALFEEYRKRFESAADPADRSRYLNALGSFGKNAQIREKALAYTIAGPLRPNELFTIPFGYNDSEEARAIVFDWYLKNYDAVIAAKVPAGFLASAPRVAGGCDDKRLARTKEFFIGTPREVEGMKREMARTEEQVRECVAFRLREAETIRTYLQK